MDVEGQRSSDAELARVRQDADAKRAALEQWCITSYGEVGWGWVRGRCDGFWRWLG